MNVSLKNSKHVQNNKIEDYTTGTLCSYVINDEVGDMTTEYFGIILCDVDGKYFLYDLESDTLYDDIQYYVVVRTYDDFEVVIK